MINKIIDGGLKTQDVKDYVDVLKDDLIKTQDIILSGQTKSYETVIKFIKYRIYFAVRLKELNELITKDEQNLQKKLNSFIYDENLNFKTFDPSSIDLGDESRQILVWSVGMLKMITDEKDEVRRLKDKSQKMELTEDETKYYKKKALSLKRMVQELAWFKNVSDNLNYKDFYLILALYYSYSIYPCTIRNRMDAKELAQKLTILNDFKN